MHPILMELPTSLETERLRLRCYRPGDGPWCYEAGQRNRAHLARYEANNLLMSVRSEDEAEVLVRRFALDWAARKQFLLAAFTKAEGVFAAQIYVGVVNWDLPELELGYFADCDHEGQGFVTEAARAALGLAFGGLGAYRVRGETDETNVRSQRVFERCGCTREAHLREDHRWPDGAITGTFCYGLLRREYEAALGTTR